MRSVAHQCHSTIPIIPRLGDPIGQSVVPALRPFGDRLEECLERLTEALGPFPHIFEDSGPLQRLDSVVAFFGNP